MFLLLSKQEGKVISSATGGWAAHPRVSRLVFFALRAGAPPAFSSPRFNWEPDLPDFCAQACQAFASWLLRGLAAFSGSDPCAVRFSGGARPLHWLPTNARRTAPEGTARPRRRPLPSKVPAAGLFRFQRSRRRGFFFFLFFDSCRCSLCNDGRQHDGHSKSLGAAERYQPHGVRGMLRCRDVALPRRTPCNCSCCAWAALRRARAHHASHWR